MTFNVSLIQLNGKVNSVKNAVISVLTEQWPLTPKVIHTQVVQVFGLNVSYQAVHKMVKSLEQDQIILKEGTKYKLNQKWIDKAKTFSEQLSEAYSVNKVGSIVVLHSVYETDKFLLSLLMQDLPKDGEKPFLGLHWNHFWVPLFLSIKEYNLLKEYAPLFDVYSLSREDTKIDRWCGSFWKNIGVHMKTGVDCAAISDLVICRDNVIEVFYQTEIKREIDKAYGKAKKIEDLDIHKFF